MKLLFWDNGKSCGLAFGKLTKKSATVFYMVEGRDYRAGTEEEERAKIAQTIEIVSTHRLLLETDAEPEVKTLQNRLPELFCQYDQDVLFVSAEAQAFLPRMDNPDSTPFVKDGQDFIFDAGAMGLYEDEIPYSLRGKFLIRVATVDDFGYKWIDRERYRLEIERRG